MVLENTIGMKMKLLLFFLATFVSFFGIIPAVHASNTFTAEYFNNMNLSGTPVLTRTESVINYNWISDSPDPSVNINEFSARWVGTFPFESGSYQFVTTADDGVRLIIDDQIIIDNWKDQAPTTTMATITMSEGNHTIKLEYYENQAGATVALQWEKAPPDTNTGTRIMPLGDSITDGYNVPGGYRINLKTLLPNSNFVGSLENGPVSLTDREHEGHSGWKIHEIQNNIVTWLQSHTPDIVLLMIGTNDILSNYEVAQAPQRLSSLIDSINQTTPNAHVLVASILPINSGDSQPRVDAFNQTIPGIVQQKKDQGKKVHYVDMQTVLTLSDLIDGIHPNATGHSKIAQKWASAIATVTNGSTPGPTPTPIPIPTPTPTPVTTGPFVARYYNNINMSGTPVLTRNEQAVNYEWVLGSPNPVVNVDNFSANWTTTQTFPQGLYEFSVTADDGVRLLVDGQILIDKWIDQPPTTYTATRQLNGDHTVVVQYYEKGSGATAKLSWKKISNSLSTPSIEIPLDNGFKAQYFNNVSLSGAPVLERLETQIQNDWVGGSPHESVSSNNFSARWEGNVTFAPNTYRFTVRADDGIRLKINNNVIIDKWIDQGPTTYTADLAVAGVANIIVEYYEKQGGAVAQMSWAQVAVPTPTPTSIQPQSGQYLAEYFSNTNLSGSPVLVQSEEEINYNWLSGSPHASVPVDNFSARWSKIQLFEAGTYRFIVTGDDGVRLKVDGQVVLDKWIDQPPTAYILELALTQGQHTIVMEYYEKGGGAMAKLNIVPVTPPPLQNPFTVEFFNNTQLSGTPVYTEQASVINYLWELGSPHASVPVDNFSVRAVQTKYYTAGTYRFIVRADDGVRVKVDGNLILDKWIDQPPTTYLADLLLTEGNHTVTIEYYEKGVGATLTYDMMKL